jgi:hypothetical protein
MGTLSGAAQAAEIHVTVGPDAALSHFLRLRSPRPEYMRGGDAVVVIPERRRRVRSMLGIHDRSLASMLRTSAQFRAEMAVGLGED